MVKAPEIRRLPRQVDVLKLCQQALVLEGQITVGELPRVAKALPGDAAGRPLQPVLRFGVDDEGHRVMHGHFDIRLPVVCQRCLEIMDYPITTDFHCAFVASDEQAKGLPAHLEPVMLEADASHVALYDLLEDELLLSLPIAAFHERCGHEQHGEDASLKSFGETEIKSRASDKPFAALAELLNRQSLKKE